MRKIQSHGTADQMLAAFQTQLDMSDDGSDMDVESSTSIRASRSGKRSSTHGTASNMLDAFDAKLAELEGETDVAAATVIRKSKPAEARKPKHKRVERNRELADGYTQELIDNINDELEDLDTFDGWSWEADENNLTLITTSENDVEEYTIPIKDLENNMEEDIEYVMKAITGSEEEAVTSSTSIGASYEVTDADGNTLTTTHDRQNVLKLLKSNKNATDIYVYNDDSSEPIEEHSAKNFIATYGAASIELDSKQVTIPEGADEEMFEDIGGGFGDAGETYSLEDLMIFWNSECDSDPSMRQYDSFDSWWHDTKTNFLKEVTSATEPATVEGSDDDMYEDESSSWKKLRGKQVEDSDGFMTDYTLYQNTDPDFSPQFICMFGDSDRYLPDEFDADAEFENLEEATEWFESYEGLGESDKKLLTREGFYAMFAPDCSADVAKKAAQILYTWYSDEDEEYMPEHSDVRDMCEVATDADEKHTVLVALGEDNESVFVLMSYVFDAESGPEADSLTSMGQFYSEDTEDANNQLVEAKKVYPALLDDTRSSNTFVVPLEESPVSVDDEDDEDDEVETVYPSLDSLLQAIEESYHGD